MDTASADQTPLVPGLTPRFRHIDEVPWRIVRAQRNSDGTEAYVHERWIAYSAAPQYLSLYARYDPGMIVRRHGHYSPHVLIVLEGDCWIGDRRCVAGTHVELPFGAAFGPIVAGDEGVVMFEVMMGDPRSWGDQPEQFERVLAERGVTALPHPPIEAPSTDL